MMVKLRIQTELTMGLSDKLEVMRVWCPDLLEIPVMERIRWEVGR